MSVPGSVPGNGARSWAGSWIGSWILAEVVEAVEAETPYGGRSVSWQEHGQVWLGPGREQPAEIVEDGRARLRPRMEAAARRDGRLVVGRSLRFRGGVWRIRSLGPDGNGLKLELEGQE